MINEVSCEEKSATRQIEMTYSIDFRKKVLAIKEKEKLTYDEAAKRFQIGKTTLVRWHKKLEPQLTRNKPATK